MNRGLRLALVLVLVFLASRALLRSLPGDPLETILAETGTTLPRELLQRELGLDRGFWDSLVHDLQNGLGRSITTREPVLGTLLAALGRTFMLSSTALLAALAAALPAALLAASRPRNSAAARIVRTAGRIALTLPSTWIGPVLLYLFAVLVPWAEFKESAALACITLALPISAQWQRLIESRLRDEIRQPFFSAARGRGVSGVPLLLRHALAPAAGAMFSILGSQWGALLGGTFVVEFIFDWPGLGTAWIQAVLQRDYPVLEGATFIAAATCLLGAFLGDFLQSAWDPRIQRAEGGGAGSGVNAG